MSISIGIGLTYLSSRARYSPPKMPGYPHLYVVFFRPRYGNYQHWILFIEDGTDKMTLEVVGHHPNFERNYLQVDPARSRNYSRKQFVGVLTKADIERVKAVACRIQMDNESWNGTARAMCSRSLMHWWRNISWMRTTRNTWMRRAL